MLSSFAARGEREIIKIWREEGAQNCGWKKRESRRERLKILLIFFHVFSIICFLFFFFCSFRKKREIKKREREYTLLFAKRRERKEKKRERKWRREQWERAFLSLSGLRILHFLFSFFITSQKKGRKRIESSSDWLVGKESCTGERDSGKKARGFALKGSGGGGDKKKRRRRSSSRRKK